MSRPERRFYIRCAMALGCGSVGRFLEWNDAEAISELMAYYSLEPFGQPWLQTGTLAAAFFQALCGKGPKPEDFLPVRPPEQPQTPDQMAAMFRAIAREHNRKRGNDRKS